MKIAMFTFNQFPQGFKLAYDSEKKYFFSNVPIVQQYRWSHPDIYVVLHDETHIYSYYSIVLRPLKVYERICMCAGLSNVITPKSYQGNGYACKMMMHFRSVVMNDGRITFGLLFCADQLVPFYRAFGWEIYPGNVYFDQADGKKTWKANTMYIKDSSIAGLSELDIEGLPW